jgi:hypothetical protein
MNMNTEYLEHLVMPSITVALTNGIRYSANHIGMGLQGNIPVVTFISSGGVNVVPASDVHEITYYATGRGYCSECDNPFTQLVPALEAQP